LLLLRFKGAVEELEGFGGFQTHRSWWVSSKEIVNSEKEGRRYLLILSAEMKVAVSQTYQSKLKERGFL